jgi:Protein of unknown function (DUF3433)
VEIYRRNDGASSEQSIFLDYRAYWAIERPGKARQRKHPLLLIGFIFSSVLTVVLNPLVARFFVANAVVLASPRQVAQDTAFSQGGLVPDQIWCQFLMWFRAVWYTAAPFQLGLLSSIVRKDFRVQPFPKIHKAQEISLWKSPLDLQI